MIVYEWRERTSRVGPPVLMEDNGFEQAGRWNFRSVYGYDHTVAALITKQGNTRNLKGKPVYSDLLLIDVDADEQAVHVYNILKSMRIKFHFFTTGNRGKHFHIPIVPMQGCNVIFSQQAWLKNAELWDYVDTSIYREGGQYRTIGAVHRKTKRHKELLETVPGDILTIRMISKPPTAKPSYMTVSNPTPENKKEYLKNLLYTRGPGSRHMHMFILWKRGHEAGFADAEVASHIDWWNTHMANPPHADADLLKKIDSFGGRFNGF